MTTIGYATLQLIPSLEGVSKEVDRQLGGTLKTAGKKSGKDFAKGVGEGLKDLEANVKSTGDAYTKLRNKAEDSLGKVRVAEVALTKARASNDNARIVAAEERLNKARRDSGSATRAATDGHSALLAAQKRLGAGSDDLGRKFGSMSSLAGSAGKALGAAGVIAGGVALAGIAALGTAAIVATRQLYDLGIQFDDLSDNLQVKTGLSGAALDKLAASVEKLGTTNVPSTFGEIGDVAAEVTRNLHLTGQPLEDITSRLANLSRMGVTVDVRSLGKAFRGFGVDVKDQVPALNGLYEASTKSGLSIDDMLAAVVKGGPALRQFGLGFGESAVLMTSFEEAGLDGEKAVNALNKAFAYFTKEGIPAEQGLRDIVTQIQSLGDTPEAGELANKVFGAKGGAAFLEAIQNGTLDLQSLSSALQTTGLDINQVSDDTGDWAEKWQNVKNELAVAVKPLATSIFDQVNTKLDDMSTWVMTHQDEVIDFFVSMGEGAISAAEVTLTALAGVVDTLHLFDTLVMKGFSWLPGYDDQAAKEFNDSLGDLSDKLNAAADSSMFNDLRTGLRDLADEAKNAADNTDALDIGIGNIAGRTIDIKTSVNGQPGPLAGAFPGAPPGSVPGQNPLDALPGPSGDAPFLIPPTGGGGGGGRGPTAGFPNSTGFAALAPRKVGSDSGLKPGTIAVKDQIASQFGNISDIGGWRPPDGYNEHSSGRAIDVMIPNWSTPAGKSEGDQVAATALKNPNVKYVLWQQTQWNADGTSSPMPDRGSPTQNHMDHVHVYTYENTGPHPTGTPASLSSNTTSLPGMAGSSGAPGLVDAYGAGYKPGLGTPGSNEYGEPGYFQVDPKTVRETQQRIDDQTERIREADENARQAQISIDELEADADDSEKDAATERKRKADYDAQVARRELSDLQGELGEAQKGDFSPAKEAPKSGSGGSSSLSLPSTFSGFGSAIGEFAGGQIGSALDVFGIGDSPPWLQAASKLISGISIGGDAGPLSAGPAGTGTVSPDTIAHGTGGGQQPGPVTNIYARDTEDAFIRQQRLEREKAAAKLSHL